MDRTVAYVFMLLVSVFYRQFICDDSETEVQFTPSTHNVIILYLQNRNIWI